MSACRIAPSASRRHVLAMIACLPLAARAVDAVPRRRLAILSRAGEEETRRAYEPFLKALASRGFADGRQVEVLVSHLRPGGPRLGERVGLLLAWKPDVIVTQGTVTTEWLLRSTKSIPIVTSTTDPVGSGFAASLARPGGNVTGLSQGAPEVAAKTMEVLRILMPRLKGLAVISFDDPPGRLIAGFPERAARAAGFEVARVPIREREDFERFFRDVASRGVQAAYWGFAPINDEKLAAREAVRHRIALMSASEENTESGMLMSLAAAGMNFEDRAADIVAQIFRGASPAQIPIEYPQRFRLVLNGRTAETLGIRLTPELRLRADRVIE